jgi:hypothetical protein
MPHHLLRRYPPLNLLTAQHLTAENLVEFAPRRSGEEPQPTSLPRLPGSFEHGLSQVSDWFWKLDEMAHTEEFAGGLISSAASAPLFFWILTGLQGSSVAACGGPHNGRFG